MTPKEFSIYSIVCLAVCKLMDSGYNEKKIISFVRTLAKAPEKFHVFGGICDAVWNLMDLGYNEKGVISFIRYVIKSAKRCKKMSQEELDKELNKLTNELFPIKKGN